MIRGTTSTVVKWFDRAPVTSAESFGVLLLTLRNECKFTSHRVAEVLCKIRFERPKNIHKKICTCLFERLKLLAGPASP